MCGIFGYSWEDKRLFDKMSKILAHRGPDDFASYTGKNITLGMRRLAIIDLKKGIYPLKNEKGNLQAVFNGELYNYKEIRADLEEKGHKFVTESDGEIIPHAFEEYGEDFIGKINGMFAIALYDEDTGRLFLFRDKLGEKPLYYFHSEKNNIFAFASEIKALLLVPEIKKEIDTDALNDYFTYRYFPGGGTVIKGVKRLLPGNYLVYGTKKSEIKIGSYWDINFHSNKYGIEPNSKFVRHLLEESVKMRLMSDVPLGAYLSGGLDSSAIVALMSKHTEEVNTFNISFSGTEFDESKYAQLVADKFGTNHTQINVDIDAIKELPSVVWHLDEPIADAATIPTYIMSRETKKKVTVILSGEGSDEIFGGYERFRHLNMAFKFRNLPAVLREIPEKILDENRKEKTGYRAAKLFSSLHNPKEAYLAYYSVFDDMEKKGLYTGKMASSSPYPVSKYFKEDFFTAIQKIDIKERLPNNMLLKGDKMTMAHSIEGRVPFLDPRLVEFSCKIPFSQKVSVLQDKIIYRKAIKGLVPEEILKRKKQGFTVPTEKWARDGLKDYLFDLVNENKEPYLKKDYIGKVAENLGKSFYYKRQFWSILMYEQWYSRFILK